MDDAIFLNNNIHISCAVNFEECKPVLNGSCNRIVANTFDVAIITGDYNYSILQFFLKLGFSQLITEKAHDGGGHLDVFINMSKSKGLYTTVYFKLCHESGFFVKVFL